MPQPRHQKRRIANSPAERLLASANGYASVSSLSKLNSAKLNVENRAYQHPVCGLGNDRYMVLEGWRLVGWANAPYRGAGRHAIVYERLTPHTDNVFEVGKFYWCHGDATKMQFCERLPEELRDELGPWVEA